MGPASNVLARADQLLSDLGAATIEHPGGKLLDHLHRVQRLLAEWGAADDVQLAGLCHAAYGTDGFPTALLELTERPRLAQVIGTEAEALVYLYGSCDRGRTYPLLCQPVLEFTDRFTGRKALPSRTAVRAFTEITAANELDVIRHSQTVAAESGAALRKLVLGLARQHLSHAAIEAWTMTGTSQ